MQIGFLPLLSHYRIIENQQPRTVEQCLDGGARDPVKTGVPPMTSRVCEMTDFPWHQITLIVAAPATTNHAMFADCPAQ